MMMHRHRFQLLYKFLNVIIINIMITVILRTTFCTFMEDVNQRDTARLIKQSLLYHYKQSQAYERQKKKLQTKFTLSLQAIASL